MPDRSCSSCGADTKIATFRASSSGDGAAACSAGVSAFGMRDFGVSDVVGDDGAGGGALLLLCAPGSLRHVLSPNTVSAAPQAPADTTAATSSAWAPVAMPIAIARKM